MTLYVVRPPNPAPGSDWIATVPGQYLYDLRGITATLTPFSGASGIAHDASGNGNDGTYLPQTIQPTAFTAGLVVGDLALQAGFPGGGVNTLIDVPPGVVDWTTNFTIMFWLTNNTNFYGTQYPFVGFAASGVTQTLTVQIDIAAGVSTLLIYDSIPGDGVWTSNPAPGFDDGLPHFVAISYDGSNMIFYVDGASIGATTFGFSPGPDATPLDTAHIGQTAQMPEIIDEYAIVRSALDVGDLDGIYALQGNFALYAPQVLTYLPTVYYHLDDTITAVGRQVTFAVTDGHAVVERIPTGFAESVLPGPFTYSWQPKLSSSTQAAGGLSTTVAIPELVLPAGYTFGPSTLDLGGSDRWSDIAIWWDSDLMDIRDGMYDYRFAPGWKLDYHYDPNAA